jgi:surface antigen
MRKLLVASVVMAMAWGAVAMNSGAQDKEKTSIKEVMKVAMKGGLCGKVAKGEATEEEKKKLAGLFAALHENTPPKGEKESWDAKTKALVDAANDVLAGKAGASDALRKAANCMACHSAHKGG